MGQIIKFPAPATKLGYKRVKNRDREAENPNQLHLFASPTAQILSFTLGQGWFERALMLDERGDPKAADFYLKAIEEQDCVPDSFCNLGIIESKSGNTAKAFDCLTNCLKHNPRHFEAHYNLGNLYFDVGDFRLAQVHYEFSSQVDPLFPNAYFNLALVLAINNDLAAAVASLLKYKELVPGQEGRKADELLHNLQKSLAALSKNVRPDAS